MSQEKVDRYKEEKKNRAKIMKKEKRQMFLLKTGCLVVGLAFLGWFGYSVYDRVKPEPVAADYTLNVDAFNDYVSSLSVEADAAETDATEEDTSTESDEAVLETEQMSEQDSEALSEEKE